MKASPNKSKKNATSIKEGEVRNPSGANGERHKGLAPWKKRVEQLLNKYSSIKGLRDFVEGPEFDVSHPIDGMVLSQLKDALQNRVDREAFLNRFDGMPKENKTVRVIGSIADLSEEELAKLAGMDE